MKMDSFNIKSALVAMLLLFSVSIMAQNTVTGSVNDGSSEPVIGATVREVGTQNAAITDYDGNFTINVSDANATLSVSYVGFLSQEVKLAGRKTIAVTLQEDNEYLDEVVVVGYGTMKKKLVTGATVQVKGDDITKLNTTQALGALQSQTPGVTIQALSGQPGEGFKVAIRGAGTNGNTTPLYVIDGVAGGDINSINPADIESIDVLKDAASCAIYGSAAANGVILITTKQGQAGDLQVSYDGSIGWQNMYKLPAMLTAKEYMQAQDLARFNTGLALWDWDSFFVGYEDLLASYRDGSNPGTNWVDEIRKKNAVTTSHALNIAGGNERSTYSMGLGYQYQDGIIGNKAAPTDFSRFTFRLNSEHILAVSDKGFNIVKVGENVYWRHTQRQGIDNGNHYSNPLSEALRMSPLIPVYNKNGGYFDWDDFVNTGMINYSEYSSNPVYKMMNNSSGNNESRSYGLNAVGYIEIQPVKGLIYRGQVSYNQSSYSWRNYLPVYKINEAGSEFRNTDEMNMNAGLGWGWNTTNTLNYKFDLDKHNFDVLAGMEYGQSRPTYGLSMAIKTGHSIIPGFDYAYPDLSKGKNSAITSGAPYGDTRSLSYFGRINYNFAEKYLFTAILRADGSSIFAPGHRWGYFPSVSGGWVVSEEAFMTPVKDFMDYFKIRAGWGQNGNNNITDGFAYDAAFGFSDRYKYSFGTGADKMDNPTSGAALVRLANEDITWETSEQINVGFDARFFRSRLNVNFDWYQKSTKDLLVYVPVSPTTGFDQQLRNAGTVRNRGIELALNWRDQIGSDFAYNIGYNIAWNKNKVTKVNSERKYNNSDNNMLSQGVDTPLSRFEEGQPIGYFYGFKTDGVIQNTTDLAAYLAANCGGDPKNSLQGDGIKVGDLKYVDYNGDGVLNAEDMTYIGDPHPDFTMGLNLGFAYKGFDFSLTGYAALGQQVAYAGYRRFADSGQDNFTTDIYSYWMGEGTSNKYPQLNVMNSGMNWQKISDIYIHNASYFRMQNITIGYDFARLWKNKLFSQFRVYAQAQNLFTITKYPGMDPENGKAIYSQSWATGIDVGNYPQPRTYLIGVNIKFAQKSKAKKAAPVYTAPETKYIEKIVEKVVEKPVVKEVVKESSDTGIYIVQFAVNDYTLTSEAKAELDKVNGTADVVAYASPEGNAENNKALSENRAKAVADYLTSKGVTVRRASGAGAPNNASNRIAIVSVK